ncbi:restriction endonuclease subunit S [Bacteroides congonensis]|uniref:restriction endonuclease subunit S n=3 Tax=Bacteroides congonensis TaxID=1871006 RepID=UPI0024B15C88|nr:restriction endonuclease subunit S [Bacteroides congonensis]
MANNSNKNKCNVPHLRFPEFSGEWDSFKLVELGKFIGGGTPSSSNLSFWTGSIPWISSSDIKEDNINNISISRYITEDAIEKSATKYCPAPVILIVSRVGVGKVALSHTSLCTSQDFCNIIEIKCHPVFLSYNLLRTMKRKSREVQGTSIKGITSDELQKIRVFIPKNKDEQNKISNLLTLLDERIATQNKIIEDLKKLKSAICEKLFCTPKDKQPKVRLHGFSDAWHFVRLSDICHRIRCKNTGEQCKQVLTIAAQYGLVSQEDFFNKNVASENLSGYYLLQKGDFAYNKSYSGDYAWGTVKRLDNYKQGVLSPLYICFRLDSARVDSDFLVYYFESKKWYKAVADIAGEGARNHGLLNISVIDYFNTIHCIPSIEEQKQIAWIMRTLSSKITQEQRMLNCCIAQRKYLLRQMFI